MVISFLVRLNGVFLYRLLVNLDLFEVKDIDWFVWMLFFILIRIFYNFEIIKVGIKIVVVKFLKVYFLIGVNSKWFLL